MRSREKRVFHFLLIFLFVALVLVFTSCMLLDFFNTSTPSRYTKAKISFSPQAPEYVGQIMQVLISTSPRKSVDKMKVTTAGGNILTAFDVSQNEFSFPVDKAPFFFEVEVTQGRRVETTRFPDNDSDFSSVKDFSPPEVRIEKIEQVEQKNFRLFLDASDPDSGISSTWFKIDGQEKSFSGEYLETELEFGEHIIVGYARNTSGTEGRSSARREISRPMDDPSPPIINMDQTAYSVFTNERVLLSGRIFDNQSYLSQVDVSFPNGYTKTYRFDPLQEEFYLSYPFRAEETGDITVRAQNGSGGVSATLSIPLQVNPNRAPDVSIEKVSGEDFSGESQGYRVVASDQDGTVSDISVVLDGYTYRQKQNIFAQSGEMSFNWIAESGGHIWQAYATDEKGARGSSDPLSIVVERKDEEGPYITFYPAGDIFSGEPAKLYMMVNDSISGVDRNSVLLAIDGVQHPLSTLDSSLFWADWTPSSIGESVLYATAKDIAGNSSGATTTVMVLDPQDKKAPKIQTFGVDQLSYVIGSVVNFSAVILPPEMQGSRAAFVDEAFIMIQCGQSQENETLSMQKNSDDSNLWVASYTPPVAGAYLATLYARSGQYQTSRTVAFTVTEANPIVEVTYTPVEPYVGQQTRLIARVTPPPGSSNSSISLSDIQLLYDDDVFTHSGLQQAATPNYFFADFQTTKALASNGYDFGVRATNNFGDQGEAHTTIRFKPAALSLSMEASPTGFSFYTRQPIQFLFQVFNPAGLAQNPVNSIEFVMKNGAGEIVNRQTLSTAPYQTGLISSIPPGEYSTLATVTLQSGAIATDFLEGIQVQRPEIVWKLLPGSPLIQVGDDVAFELEVTNPNEKYDPVNPSLTVEIYKTDDPSDLSDLRFSLQAEKGDYVDPAQTVSAFTATSEVTFLEEGTYYAVATPETAGGANSTTSPQKIVVTVSPITGTLSASPVNTYVGRPITLTLELNPGTTNLTIDSVDLFFRNVDTGAQIPISGVSEDPENVFVGVKPISAAGTYTGNASVNLVSGSGMRTTVVVPFETPDQIVVLEGGQPSVSLTVSPMTVKEDQSVQVSFTVSNFTQVVHAQLFLDDRTLGEFILPASIIGPQTESTSIQVANLPEPIEGTHTVLVQVFDPHQTGILATATKDFLVEKYQTQGIGLRIEELTGEEDYSGEFFLDISKNIIVSVQKENPSVSVNQLILRIKENEIAAEHTLAPDAALSSDFWAVFKYTYTPTQVGTVTLSATALNVQSNVVAHLDDHVFPVREPTVSIDSLLIPNMYVGMDVSVRIDVSTDFPVETLNVLVDLFQGSNFLQSTPAIHTGNNRFFTTFPGNLISKPGEYLFDVQINTISEQATKAAVLPDLGLLPEHVNFITPFKIYSEPSVRISLPDSDPSGLENIQLEVQIEGPEDQTTRYPENPSIIADAGEIVEISSFTGGPFEKEGVATVTVRAKVFNQILSTVSKAFNVVTEVVNVRGEFPDNTVRVGQRVHPRAVVEPKFTNGKVKIQMPGWATARLSTIIASDTQSVTFEVPEEFAIPSTDTQMATVILMDTSENVLQEASWTFTPKVPILKIGSFTPSKTQNYKRYPLSFSVEFTTSFQEEDLELSCTSQADGIPQSFSLESLEINSSGYGNALFSKNSVDFASTDTFVASAKINANSSFEPVNIVEQSLDTATTSFYVWDTPATGLLATPDGGPVGSVVTASIPITFEIPELRDKIRVVFSFNKVFDQSTLDYKEPIEGATDTNVVIYQASCETTSTGESDGSISYQLILIQGNIVHDTQSNKFTITN